ncbi:hypothetical protein ARALYDRAFT_901780 [Arabidopsis lyrata subsp. lyrata]|uniref:MATH domain-containing protein n=1 Tax=Arabidopsis lyrata subsp. lyrata TaxID=81972 RepID=D7LJ30_ARALL|nr:hypothetical protein ARALYDRAFT_901780 [Arabidopsis lyrata subsp. lyrata]
MTSFYKNTISLAYLFCLLATSSSASSFIRQFTDDSNKPLQPYYLHKKENSSRDYKVTASNVVKGLRDRPPSSYSMKMESFNTLLKSANAQGYESRPFSVGGYNCRSGYLSLYVAIDKSTPIAAQKEIYADLRFYIFNKNERKYLTIQDTDIWKFNVFKTMWGFSQVLTIDTFKNPTNGYLYDGDHCEFGVDVTIPPLYEKSEFFSVTENFHNPRFTWTIQRFSMLLKDIYLSDMFYIRVRNWNIQVNPNGRATGEGKALSMYLNLNVNEKFKPYEKIYVRAKLRVLNQRNLNNLERPLDNWFIGPEYGNEHAWGYHEFISFSDLRDSSKGFVVNDVLKVQVEMEAISSTKYSP